MASEKPDLWATLKFDANGLVPAIAQQYDTNEILMMAWMNRETLLETLETGQACYWSRSRARPWRKGETSGQRQVVREILVDCDGDTLVLKVDQTGLACHTGRKSCFYRKVHRNGTLEETGPVLIEPQMLYHQES